MHRELSSASRITGSLLLTTQVSGSGGLGLDSGLSLQETDRLVTIDFQVQRLHAQKCHQACYSTLCLRAFLSLLMTKMKPSGCLDRFDYR